MLEHLGQNINRFWKLALRVVDWPPKFDGMFFSALGPIQGHKVQHLLVLGVD
jgi:hypothetical protein